MHLVLYTIVVSSHVGLCPDQYMPRQLVVTFLYTRELGRCALVVTLRILGNFTLVYDGEVLDRQIAHMYWDLRHQRALR